MMTTDLTLTADEIARMATGAETPAGVCLLMSEFRDGNISGADLRKYAHVTEREAVYLESVRSAAATAEEDDWDAIPAISGVDYAECQSTADALECALAQIIHDACVRRDPISLIADVLRAAGPVYDGGSGAGTRRDIASDWDDHGFSADEVGEWVEIGCWEPATAAIWRDAGLTPAHVSAAADKLIDAEREVWDAIDDAAAEDGPGWTPCNRESDYTTGSPIYSCCNADTDPQVIIDAAKQAD